MARVTKTHLVIFLIMLSAGMCVAQSDPRWVTGTYRNPALGYSITVPAGLKGLTGDQAGPERGLRISLPSGGVISVWGEPNSLEWKTPGQGMHWSLGQEECASRRQAEVLATTVGKLNGARGVLVCGERVIKMLLVFRPGGGPIYWLRLETAAAHSVEDGVTLSKLAATFNIIRWD